MSVIVRASECRVRKNIKSFLGSRLNLCAARSLASVAAFLVKARKAIRCGCTPLARASSTILSSVVVFPVPGGPNILNISCFLPFVYLLHTLFRDVVTFCNGCLGHALFVYQSHDFLITFFGQNGASPCDPNCGTVKSMSALSKDGICHTLTALPLIFKTTLSPFISRRRWAIL